MLALRLPPEVEERLTELARKTGRTKSYYAKKAIIEYLEELEDYYLGEAAYQEFIAGDQKTYTIDEARNLL